MESSKQSAIKIRYPLCDQGGLHEGEYANIVVLDKKSEKNTICCPVCVDEKFQGQKTKPLKIIIAEIKNQVSVQSTDKIDENKLQSDLEVAKQASLQNFKEVKGKIVDKLNEIEDKIEKFYEKLSVELNDLQMANDVIQQVLGSITQNEQLSIDDLKKGLDKILEVYPLDPSDVLAGNQPSIGQQTTEILQDNIKNCGTFNLQCTKDMETGVNDVIQKTLVLVNNKIEQKNILAIKKTNFVFSKFKHENIIKISDTIVKSGGTAAGYKFAIMEPSLQDGGNLKKTFAFRLKEVNTSNWIAVGICHRQIIVDKNYAFSFNLLGHGSYMISSNGGTWSNTNAELNNVVKSFKFGKGDVVICEYDPSVPQIIFKKKNKPLETHKLDIKYIASDLLYPCVLFYYLNDEVEFLNDYKDKD